jgi:uncharacterized protein (DUF3820 family)
MKIKLIKKKTIKIKVVKDKNPKSLWIIPFGKHKGIMIEDIETSYLEWIIGEEWFKTKFEEGYKAIQQELKFRKDFPESKPEKDFTDSPEYTDSYPKSSKYKVGKEYVEFDDEDIPF